MYVKDVYFKEFYWQLNDFLSSLNEICIDVGAEQCLIIKNKSVICF
jgi:hypothetical protein